MSSNTGALSRARPRLAVEAVFDQIFTNLKQPAQAGGGLLSRLFPINGSSIRLPHSAALTKAYPPDGNHHGEAHWPVIRILVAPAGWPCAPAGAHCMGARR